MLRVQAYPEPWTILSLFKIRPKILEFRSHVLAHAGHILQRQPRAFRGIVQYTCLRLATT